MSLNELDLQVINLLAQDARMGAPEMAVRLGEAEETISRSLAGLYQQGIVVGHTVLVDWDRAGRELVQALIEVKVTPQREQGFDAIAAQIYRFDEVRTCCLMSGGYDLMLMVEAPTLKQLAFFVSDKLSAIDNVLSTATHFVLKKYKTEGVFMKAQTGDPRLVVSL